MFPRLNVGVLAQEEENVGNIKRQLAKIFEVSLRATVPEETDVEPLVAACAGKFGDYQWYVMRNIIVKAGVD